MWHHIICCISYVAYLMSILKVMSTTLRPKNDYVKNFWFEFTYDKLIQCFHKIFWIMNCIFFPEFLISKDSIAIRIQLIKKSDPIIVVRVRCQVHMSNELIFIYFTVVIQICFLNNFLIISIQIIKYRIMSVLYGWAYKIRRSSLSQKQVQRRKHLKLVKKPDLGVESECFYQSSARKLGIISFRVSVKYF